MGSEIVADPSHKGSDVFASALSFQELTDGIMIAHEGEMKRISAENFED